MASNKMQHGVKGCYYGGKWVDVEDLTPLIEVCKVQNSAKLNRSPSEQYPRSKSRNTSVKADGTYDVVVIGAGCLGASVARELSKTVASVLLLESADDVTQGATKGSYSTDHCI